MTVTNLRHLKKTLAAGFAAILALSMFAGSALAQPPDITERGNALRSVATPVELSEDDVRLVEFGDTEYVAVDHNLGSWNQLVWREPARLGGANEVSGPDMFNTLYLGVAGPAGGEISHKGQVSVYYEVDGEWRSIIAQFNGQGELVHVNGVTPSE